MVRGTTAQFKFNTPYTKGELLWATVQFWQTGNNGTSEAPLPITKKLSHCDSPDDSMELCFSLTAEETARFSDKLKAKVQFRAQCKNGTVFGSRPQLISVYPMSDGIIEEDPTLPLPDEDENGFVILDGEDILA